MAALVVLGVLGLSGFFAARPIYRVIKAYRASNLADEIDTLLLGTNYVEAGRSIRVAIGLAPGNPRIVRQAATFLTALGSADALTYWEMLLGMGEATRDDRLKYIHACLNASRLETAQVALKELLKKDPRDAEALALSVRMFELALNFGLARQTARSALAAHPFEHRFQFLAGKLLMTTGTNLAQRAEGRRLLWGLAVAEGPYHEAALSLLVPNSELTRGENEVLIRSLLGRTNLPLADKLSAASLRIKISPERRLDIVNETVDAVAPSIQPEERPVLGVWILNSGVPQRALDVVPESVVGTNQALTAIRLESLAALGQWESVQRWLDSPTAAVDPVALACLRGRAAKAAGRNQQVATNFDEALRLASKDPKQLVSVARHAERVGLTNVALEAWRRVAVNPALVLQAAREIVRLVEPRDDVRGLRDALARVAEFIPNDPDLLARLAYLNLLLNEDIAKQHESIKRIAAANPTNTVFRMTLAFADFRSGKSAEALPLLEQEDVDWDKAEARWQAVYGAVLAANGQREAARGMARRISPGALKTPERDLLRGLL